MNIFEAWFLKILFFSFFESFFDHFVIQFLLPSVSGNAQAGHYYSFIKDRTTTGLEKKERWCKFDDQSVSEWDIDRQLVKDTYGGSNEDVSTKLLHAASKLL